MMLKKTGRARVSRLAARLRTLVFREGVLEGTVTNMTVGGSRRTTFTDKADGKTRCLYVPQRRLPEVDWLSGNWREAKAILKEMSDVCREDLIARMKGSSKDSASSTGTGPAAIRAKTPKVARPSKK